jgi:hypothetical protein
MGDLGIRVLNCVYFYVCATDAHTKVHMRNLHYDLGP